MFSLIEVQTVIFSMILHKIAKLFVPLHRRLCLTLVRIAKFQIRVYMETQTAVHTSGLPICAYRRVFGDTLRGVTDGAVHISLYSINS
jgi:hypothetical protein